MLISAYMDREEFEQWLEDNWDDRDSGKESTTIKTVQNNTLGKRIARKTANMTAEEYAIAKELWSKFKEVEMSQKEKEHVYEEFDNNLTVEEKENSLVHKTIGDYNYYAVNKGHNQYKIYKKVPIEPYADVVDEVLSEMFGRDWKRQWEEINRLRKN